MNNIVLGRFVPYNSFMHKLDPRNKILGLILLMVAIFIEFDSWTLTFVIGGLLFLFVGLLLIISKVSFKDMFSSLKTVFIMMFILLTLNILIKPTKISVGPAFNIGNLVIYWDSILQSAKIVVRLILMLSLTMILTSTTSPNDMTYAFEWLLAPLKVVKFPVHAIAMTISLALRLIPTLLDETQRIMNAQASRGVDFERGKLSNKVRAISSLIIPLFISAFERSDELANAMESRGYDPNGKRTKYRVLSWNKRDTISLILCFLILVGTIFASLNLVGNIYYVVLFSTSICLLYILVITILESRKYL